MYRVTPENCAATLALAPEAVRQAVRRAESEPLESATRWVYQWCGEAERQAVDDWLVRISHPLAFKAGTAEQRFRAVVRELRDAPIHT